MASNPSQPSGAHPSIKEETKWKEEPTTNSLMEKDDPNASVWCGFLSAEMVTWLVLYIDGFEPHTEKEKTTPHS